MEFESEDEIEELAEEYEKRNERIQEVIDTLAEYEPTQIDEFGFKTELARENDLDEQRIHYVLDRWESLIKFRRHANRNPLDPHISEEAYDDETMKQMAQKSQPVADGMGNVTIPVELQLDEVFRCMKLLPSDLGMRFFSQTLEKSDTIPQDRLFEILNDNE